MTVAQALQNAYLNIDVVDAQLLLQHVLKQNHAALLTHPERTLNALQEKTFLDWVARRQHGEPVAYLVGEREFYSLNFKITNAVLIPRPETELLVEAALQRIPLNAPCKVLDLGTGSGAVAIAIARHRPQAQIIATDISADALVLSEENARRLGASNVRFICGDWFGALAEIPAEQLFEVIVSNPPYIAAQDPHLQQGDLRFEPQAALASGIDGLDAIRQIINSAPTHLSDGGSLLFEHGYDQARSVRQILKLAGFINVFSLRDLAGIARVSSGRCHLDGRNSTQIIR